MAYDTKRYAAAARLWAEALAADPKLGDDRRAGHRYNAACAAALAAAGQGKDEPPPDDAAKAELRRKALEWLRAELAAWSKVLESGRPAGPRRRRRDAADTGRQDTDLAGIRDGDALATLPADERRAWEAFWKDVDALLKGEARPGPAGSEPSGTAAVRPGEATGRVEALDASAGASSSRDARARRGRGARPHPQAGPRARTDEAGRGRAAVPPGARGLPQGAGTGRGLDPRLDARPGRPPGPDRPRRRGRAVVPRRAWNDRASDSGPPTPARPVILAVLGLSLIQQGKWAEAEAILRECLAIREKVQPDEWTTFNTRSLLGGSLLGQKKYAEAEPLIVSGYEGMKAREAKIPPPGKPRLAEAAERVVKLYEAWGKKDKAAEWRARLAKPSDGTRNEP